MSHLMVGIKLVQLVQILEQALVQDLEEECQQMSQQSSELEVMAPKAELTNTLTQIILLLTEGQTCARPLAPLALIIWGQRKDPRQWLP